MSRMVNVLMKMYLVYCKERTMIESFIEDKGIYYFGGGVLEMHARVDSVEAAMAKQK